MDFSDRDAPYHCLEIMENKQHSRAKVLTLKVHPPVISTFPLVKKTLDTYHHLPEWSSTKMKDVTDNFSGNVITKNVLLLKSSTHQNVVVAIPLRHDENLSSWRVPSSGFGEACYTSGYWEWVEDVLAHCKESLDNIRLMMLSLLQCSYMIITKMFSRPFARIGVHPPIRSLPSSESYLFLYGI
ncbi:hypothetical protein KY285_033191 [Solanum tuberosum]|nr:hypothetical protein KY289_033295 [Solanum tuberosum]KAH0647943.1 hypothetical protein KY285_033191 [Solanum tuberosum]